MVCVVEAQWRCLLDLQHQSEINKLLSSFKLRLGNAAAVMFCEWGPAALGAAPFLSLSLTF